MDKILRLPEDFECPICYECAVPPVHKCENGHITCGICFDKVERCSLCRKPLLHWNDVDKSMGDQNIKLKCRNEQEGCSKIIKATHMKNHLSSNCEFRALACGRLGHKNCDATCINLTSYVDHLKITHGQTVRECIENNVIILRVPASFLKVKRNVWFAVFKFDEITFLIHRIYQKETLFYNLCVIGDEQLSSKYYCRVLLSNVTAFGSESSQKMCTIFQTWTLDVSPYHKTKMHEFQSEREAAAIDCSNFYNFFDKKDNEQDVNFPKKYRTINFNICKRS